MIPYQDEDLAGASVCAGDRTGWASSGGFVTLMS
jgi:hypothetical protein